MDFVFHKKFCRDVKFSRTSSFENDVANFGYVKQTKDTNINNCHNKMWNDSNVFSSSVPGFSRSPKQSV